MISYWSTSTQNTIEKTYGKKNSHPKTILKMLKDSKGWDNSDYGEVKNDTLHIHTSQKGVWIGTKGWRIKNLQKCCKITLNSVFSIDTGAYPVIKIDDISICGRCSSDEEMNLYTYILDKLQPYKIGSSRGTGSGDQRLEITNYFEKPALKILSDLKKKISDTFSNIEIKRKEVKAKEKLLFEFEKKLDGKVYIPNKGKADAIFSNSFLNEVEKVIDFFPFKIGVYPNRIYLGGKDELDIMKNNIDKLINFSLEFNNQFNYYYLNYKEE